MFFRFFRGKNGADLIQKMSQKNLENQFSKRKNKKQINPGAQRKKKKLNKYCPDAKIIIFLPKTFVGTGICF